MRHNALYTVHPNPERQDEMFTEVNGVLLVHPEPKEQSTLLGQTKAPVFDGDTYSERHDQARLTGQLARVRDCMADGCWRTLDEIKAVTGDQTQAISARLRDLRKIRFGMHTVDRRRRGEGSLGIWEYRLAD